MKQLLQRGTRRARRFYYHRRVALFGKVPFRDRYGLRYYLWPDTRLDATLVKGVRTDDTGVIDVARALLAGIGPMPRQVVCFDVGAYIGVIYLAMASAVGGRGRVFAFEPSPRNFPRLLANVHLNRTLAITPHNLAMLDAAGEALLKAASDPGGDFVAPGNSGRPAWDGARAGATVATDTIDRFAAVQGISHIDLLKVDAEGSDALVLAGARQMLSAGAISYVLFEAESSFESAEDCRSLLAGHGYETFFIVRDADFVVRDLEAYPDGDYRPALNGLAISRSAPVSLAEAGIPVRG